MQKLENVLSQKLEVKASLLSRWPSGWLHEATKSQNCRTCGRYPKGRQVKIQNF